MKARPRAAENRIAKELNKVFSDLNITPFERIPVLGRTGPDLTINELGLVVDVKSRLECPKGLFVRAGKGYLIPEALRVYHLSDVGKNDADLDWGLMRTSKMARNYFYHMDAWTHEQNNPDLITAVVLHRPGMAYANAVLIMRSTDRLRLLEKIERIKNGK